jgi:Zn-dependent protease with chaperone function
MRLRFLLLPLLACLAMLAGSGAARASTTPTEAAALAAAKNDHTAYTLPPEKLAKAEHISHLYDTLHFVDAGWGMLALLLILELGIAARLRNAVLKIGPNRWVQGFGFLLGFLLIDGLLGLPVSAYAHHESVLFGFSVQGWGSWLWDQTKTLLLAWIFGGLFVMLLFRLIDKFPRRWWLWLWFPTMAIVLFSVYVTPYVIDPLFHKFEPLSQTHPELVAQLERVAAQGNGLIDIPPQRMFLMRASEKTTLLNAYVTGFGSSKRLVIWDTLPKAMTTDEISMVAGHEMGHYVLGHIVRGIVFYFVFILVSFFLGFHLFQFLLRRFGARWGIREQRDWAALVVMILALTVVAFLGEPVSNTFQRGLEHDADVFGLEAVHGIVANPQQAGRGAFQVLGETSYDAPDPSAFVEFWTDSHPSIPSRAAFALHYDPWAPGAEPKYFKK